jgi:hypothetical protein
MKTFTNTRTVKHPGSSVSVWYGSLGNVNYRVALQNGVAKETAVQLGGFFRPLSGKMAPVLRAAAERAVREVV